MREAARLREPASGRTLLVSTDQPGLQFYSGNFLDGTMIGKAASPMRIVPRSRSKPSNFPDAPNKQHFPAAVLRPERAFKSCTIFQLGVE